MKIAPITPEGALAILKNVRHDYQGPPFAFAIAVVDGDHARGVIGMHADGVKCGLGHLWTDGTELVGSILYGAAWRACKALGYSEVSL